MLSFEEKRAVVESFPELERKNVSLGRINYHYEKKAPMTKRLWFIICIRTVTVLFMPVFCMVTIRMTKVGQYS